MTERTAYNVFNSHELFTAAEYFADMTITFEPPNRRTELNAIAHQLGLEPDAFAARVTKDNATLPKAGYVSLMVNPIPEAIAAKPKSLTRDTTSDATTLAEIARQLGIDPAEFARRLAADASEEEGG